MRCVANEDAHLVGASFCLPAVVTFSFFLLYYSFSTTPVTKPSILRYLATSLLF